MIKRLWIILLVASVVLSGGLVAVEAAVPLEQNTAQITTFTTTATSVDRASLVNRTARIPVTWATANRPNTSNLVFEQLLPNGQAVNVELPRQNAYVSSSGDGVVAPLSPGNDVNEIHIRVTLLDVITPQTVYSQKEIVIPIAAAAAPVIRSFATSAAGVNKNELDAHLARLPVSWQVDNRPDGSNLVFEQVLDNGSSVNVELPRTNPFVASSGSGVVAPQPPGGSSTSIKLRLRLVNLADNSTIVQQDITVPIVQNTPAQPLFSVFSTSATSVSRASLVNKAARIPVAWQVYNRPPNSNLVFEQVLDNGSVVNVELPRDNPFVDDQGIGVAAAVAPGGSSTNITLQIRLIDLGSKAELAKDTLTVPISESTANPTIQSFTTSVASVNRAFLTNKSERVPVAWQVDNRPPNSNLVFEQVLSDNSAVNVELPRNNPIVPSSGLGIAAPGLPGGNATSIILQLRLVDLGTQATLAKQVLSIPIVEQPAPTISSFATSATSVSPAALANKTARVPVTWQVAGRYDGTNLIFEQVLSDNSVVNVELPRSNPIVPSSGVGVAAPVAPGGNATSITLRLRVVDLTTQATLAQQNLTVPISDAAQTPVIRAFTTTAVSVSLAELTAKTARIPVTWAVDNRADNTNLVFEQVLDNGTVVNVELPRSNPIVPSSGNGVAAPVAPTNPGTTAITLRLRIIDLGNQSTLAQQTLNIPISAPSTGNGIQSFSTAAIGVDFTALANNTARIPVSWAVNNRPANSNLIFEQVLPDGSVVNVELPRSNRIVGSVGSGVAAAVAPGGLLPTNLITLRLRLVNLSNNTNIDQKDITVPITSDSSAFVANVDPTQCYSNGFAAGNNLLIGGRGRVTTAVGANGVAVLSAARNGQILGTMQAGATFTVSDGPTCFHYTFARPWTQLYWRVWKVKAESGSLEGYVPEYLTPANGAAQYILEALGAASTGGTGGTGATTSNPVTITSFTASPNPVARGGGVTLNWSVGGTVARVAITLASADGSSTISVIDNQPATGSTTTTLSNDFISQAQFSLSAFDSSGQETKEDLAVNVTCPFASSLSEDCPVTQATNVNSAYQSFEKGQMIWRGDLKKIYVLYGDGSWSAFDDTWTDADGQTAGPDAPAGLFRPEHGFGKVWTQIGGQPTLGWATEQEQGYTATWETHQLIEGGAITEVPHFTLPDGTVVHTGDHWTTG